MPNIFIYLDHTDFSSTITLNNSISEFYETDMVLLASYKDDLFTINFPETHHDKQARLKHLYQSFVDLINVKIDSPLTLDQFLAFIGCIKQNRSLGIASDGWYLFGEANLGEPDAPWVSSLFDSCVQACAQDCTEINLYPYGSNKDARADANRYLLKQRTQGGFCLDDVTDVSVTGLVAQKSELAAQMFEKEPTPLFDSQIDERFSNEMGAKESQLGVVFKTPLGLWCDFWVKTQSKMIDLWGANTQKSDPPQPRRRS